MAVTVKALLSSRGLIFTVLEGGLLERGLIREGGLNNKSRLKYYKCFYAYFSAMEKLC